MYGVLPVQGPGHHVHDCQPQYTQNTHPGICNSAKPLRNMRVADIDIALDCQGKGQPVGGSVEDLRSCLKGKLKNKARETAPLDGDVAIKGEGIYVPGKEKDNPMEYEEKDLTKGLAG